MPNIPPALLSDLQYLVYGAGVLFALYAVSKLLSLRDDVEAEEMSDEWRKAAEEQRRREQTEDSGPDRAA